MFPQGREFVRRRGDEHAFLFVVPERFAAQKGNRCVENRRVPGYLDVFGDGVRQPDQIVGTAGSHAEVGIRMPPVLNVAERKLARGAGQDVFAGEMRRGVEKSQRILKLIAESESSARLVQRRAAPE